MKKQVFRLITFSLLLISTVLLWTNCQKDSSTESTPDFGDVDVAGKLHNEGLDFVIARLNYQSASNDRIFDATKDFMLVKHPDWANRKDFIDSRPSDKLDYLSTFSDETKGAITKLFTDLSKKRISNRTSNIFSLTMLRDIAGFINNYGSLMEIYGGSERGEAYAYNQAVQGGIYESSR